MPKSRHTEVVPRLGDKIHIPLKTDDALRLALKIKPTKDMPRPGASGKNKKAKLRKPRTRVTVARGVTP